MNLLTISAARSIWLFQIFDWNPRGRSLNPVYFSLIEKYTFQKYPKLHEIDWQKGIKFEDGVFSNQAGEQLAVNLTVFNDGLVADTRSSTIDSDYFLEQTLGFLTSEFGFPDYQLILRKKAYASEMVIRLERPTDSINPKLRAFADRLSALIPNDNVPFRVGINLVSDPGSVGTALNFRLEPALGFPFSENRYYSLAPVPTDVHLTLLQEFEATFIT